MYVVGRKGDPRGLLVTMLRHLRDAGLRVTAANHEFSAGQFEINLDHSELVDSADRAFRLKSAVQEIARHHDLLATFMAKPFNDEGGSGFHLHVSLVDDAGHQPLRRRVRRRTGCPSAAAPPSPASSRTRRRWPPCSTRRSTPTSGSAPTPSPRG